MFITFEGGEGTGKTTLIETIYQQLKTTHHVIKTREPGGSMIAEAIRDIILNPKYEGPPWGRHHDTAGRVQSL